MPDREDRRGDCLDASFKTLREHTHFEAFARVCSSCRWAFGIFRNPGQGAEPRERAHDMHWGGSEEGCPRDVFAEILHDDGMHLAKNYPRFIVLQEWKRGL